MATLKDDSVTLHEIDAAPQVAVPVGPDSVTETVVKPAPLVIILEGHDPAVRVGTTSYKKII